MNSIDSNSDVAAQDTQGASRGQMSRKIAMGVLALLLGLSGSWLIWSVVRRGEPPAPAAQTPVVETEVVQPTEVRITSEFVGALEAQERVLLRPEVEGRITQIFVESGDRLSIGTPILQLSPDRPQAIVTGAIADIEMSQAARRAAAAGLLEAEAERDSAIAEKNLQDQEYERIQTLVNEGALPQQSLDVVLRNREAAIAALTAAERRIQSARATLEEATASLQRAQSDVAVAVEDLSDYQIVSPINGVVGDLPMKVGDYVNTGELLTTLTQNQRLELRLSIPVERSSELRQGLPVELRTEVGGEPLVTGRISFVSERVEDEAQSILAKATFPNPRGLLRDEQFVRATVIWDEDSGVLVPTTAISRIGGQSFVFVVEPVADLDAQPNSPNPTPYIAVQRPVELGIIEGDRYHVTRGLAPGETLITTGILRLSDGAPVNLEATPTSNSRSNSSISESEKANPNSTN